MGPGLCPPFLLLIYPEPPASRCASPDSTHQPLLSMDCMEVLLPGSLTVPLMMMGGDGPVSLTNSCYGVCVDSLLIFPVIPVTNSSPFAWDSPGFSTKKSRIPRKPPGPGQVGIVGDPRGSFTGRQKLKKYFLIKICLTYNIIVVSGVQCSDSSFIHLTM